MSALREKLCAWQEARRADPGKLGKNTVRLAELEELLVAIVDEVDPSRGEGGDFKPSAAGTAPSSPDGAPASEAERRARARATVPAIAANQVWSAPGNDGETFRRIRILAAHPDGGWIIQDLPSKMNRHSSLRELGVCPEFNLRYVFTLEEPAPLAMLVLVGESDDHVEAVFTSEEKARAYCAAKGIDLGGDNSWWYDEVALDPEAPSGATA